MIKEVKKNTAPWTYVIDGFNGEKIIGTFYEIKFTRNKPSRIWNTKKKGDKLYVKWKEYDNLFNSWIDKKDVT